MKIVQVIHGYPMRYNAGSEVYTQTLCHGLAARGHAVHVFTREEDPFAPDGRVRREPDPACADVAVHVVNHAESRDRYRSPLIDQQFAELLDELHPEVVHVGHLNHLSTSLVLQASARSIPILFTLHDYWLMCPRGQLMQMHARPDGEPWPACDGQADRKCAERCYARYHSGAPEEHERDVAYWADWVARRMRHVREVAEHVDLFLAPSHDLRERYVAEFGIPAHKVEYLDYGFDRRRLTGRRRIGGEPFTFGYIGTHIAAKGVDRLIRAFAMLTGDARLRIWGRPRGQETAALKALAASLPRAGHVEWLPEYRNQDITADVFDRVDALVVPSIWLENSPLVIHEAQQARVPVVTADVGGMAEYVRHEVNGLLFRHRDVETLAREMQRLADDPAWAMALGRRGYLGDLGGDVPAIEDHVARIEETYQRLQGRRDRSRVTMLPGPWRITLDTNPDTCNLKCIMCEEHSPHSDRQVLRKAAGERPRLMPLEVLRTVVAEAAANGLRELIPSTMGEPLLYEHFDEIVELCRAHRVKLNLTTNGTFPRRGAREWAQRLVPVTSDIKVSWNGASARTHESVMLGVRWEQVLANVRELVAVRDEHERGGGDRCRVTFQMTFLEANIAEVPDVVRLARTLGVDRVKGHHLWAHFDAIREQSMRRSHASIERWNETVLAARAAADEATLPNGRRVLLENFFLLDPAMPADLAPGGACPFLGQEAWVSARGTFGPCCAPDAQRQTLGNFGAVQDGGLMAIWKSDAYRRLVAGYRTRALCVGCNMRRPEAGA
ncbi:MAG: glycosyltransferase [Myxococcales bacterium]|nr:glycosyltransferase [Myxococcales bacterium]